MSDQTVVPEVLTMARELAALPEDTDANAWPPYRQALVYGKTPRLWAEVCLLAMALTESPVLLIWFMIEFVNGWRRQDELWDIALASKMLDAVKLRIERLPEDHPRRVRLLGLWAYHGAWGVYQPAGEFVKAAEAHRLEASFATNEHDRTLALCMVAYNELCAALVQGVETAVSQAYDALVEADHAFATQLAETREDVRWRLNLACQRLLFTWLCKKECPTSAAELACLEQAPVEQKEAFAMVLPLARALEARRSGNFPGAIELTAQTGEQIHPHWRCLTLLLRAELLAVSGDQGGVAAAHLEILTIAAHAHGAHLAKALVLQRRSAP